MQISLQQILPTFFENGKAAGSQLWNQSLSFNKGENIHIIAPSGSGKNKFYPFFIRPQK
jgi:ABC-type lipoprotein export system ATPase subunit